MIEQIDNRSDQAETGCKQIGQAHSNMPQVESVNTGNTNEGQQRRHQDCHLILSTPSIHVGKLLSLLLSHAQYDLRHDQLLVSLKLGQILDYFGHTVYSFI